MVPMPVFRGLKILDYVSILIFAALVVASVFWSAGGRNGELRVEIEASGLRHVMPLSRNGDLIVEGPVGETHVHVEDGRASVSDSDCRDKICVAMGEISRTTGWIACLPNRVFVRIVAVGDEDGEAVDAGAF